MTQPQPRIIYIEELAAMLGREVPQARILVRRYRHILKPFKVGRVNGFTPEAVEDFIQKLTAGDLN